MNKTKQLIQKTNGKKTESVGVLMMLFQAFLLLFPDKIPPNTENAIELILGSGVIGTLFHRIWRNKKEIGKYLAEKFKSLKTAENE